jgi:LysR family transcriptional regulator, glycine cleavage system transcriptional activator
MARTPSLDAFRIFVVAARHLSFTQAAAELNLTQSAVSHRIRALEEELGIELFKRLARRLELTAVGRGLAHSIGHAIAEIDRSIADLSRPADARPVKVTMLPSVASYWLIPRLPRIRSQHPDLEIQVIADSRLLDLRAEQIDLAIRFGRAPSPGYSVTRLMGDLVLPVCAPGLLERCGPVAGIEALLALPLLHDSATDDDGSNSNWRAWLDHLGRHDMVCRAGQQFSEAGMLINAAILGLGVALARASLVVDQMASGTLVCPLRLTAPTAFAYYLIGLPEVMKRPRIALFRSLLVAEAAATEASMASMGNVSGSDQDVRPVAPGAT